MLYLWQSCTMYRDMHYVLKQTNIQAFKHVNIQTCKHSNMQTFKHANLSFKLIISLTAIYGNSWFKFKIRQIFNTFCFEDCDYTLSSGLFCFLWVWFWFSLHLEIKMSESMFYLCWLVNFDSVLKYLFRSGTPRNQVVPQSSTTIAPPPLKPATNTGTTLSVANTVLVAIPVVIAVLCCFGCVAWCKIKTGWVLCLLKWI